MVSRDRTLKIGLPINVVILFFSAVFSFAGMISFSYLTDFSYFLLKIVFPKLLDTVRSSEHVKYDHFERGV